MAICPRHHLGPASQADLGLSFPATQAAPQILVMTMMGAWLWVPWQCQEDTRYESCYAL